jgi:WD40 repeat protein
MYAIIMFEDVCRRTRTADGIVIDRVKRPRVPRFISIGALTLLIWQLIFVALSIECAAVYVGRAQAATTEPAGAMKPPLPNLQLVRELQTSGRVSTLVWSSDGTKLAAGSLGGLLPPFYIQNPYGKVIIIWDSAGHIIRQIQRETAFFGYDDTFALVSGDAQLATPPLSATNGFTLFDISTGELVNEIPGLHPGRPRNVNGAKVLVASPDQSILAVIFGHAIEQPVALYSTQNWNKVHDLWIRSPNRLEQPRAVAFSRDGKILAASELNRYVSVYDLDTNRIIREIDAFPDRAPAATAIAFSPDGSVIALGSSGESGVNRRPDGRIEFVPPNNPPLRIFKVDNGELVAAYGNSPAITSGLAWSFDGRFLAFITGRRVLHIWNPFQADNSERIIDLSATQRSGPIALSPNGAMLAVGVGQSVRVYEIAR